MDEPRVMAGQVNPNNAPVPVLVAILSGAMKNDSITAQSHLDPERRQALATQFASQIAANPLRSRADLVAINSAAITASLGSINDLANKSYGEAPLRALASVTNTRTWNLLIDVIAQSGQMSPSATKLDDFIVMGERRYWLHIAIDRYSGKIIDQQLETVYE